VHPTQPGSIFSRYHSPLKLSDAIWFIPLDDFFDRFGVKGGPLGAGLSIPVLSFPPQPVTPGSLAKFTVHYRAPSLPPFLTPQYSPPPLPPRSFLSLPPRIFFWFISLAASKFHLGDLAFFVSFSPACFF